VQPRRTLLRFGRGGSAIQLASGRGSLSVDVLDDLIVAVEILDRPDIWDALTPRAAQPAR
jgi:hypothetical protein